MSKPQPPLRKTEETESTCEDGAMQQKPLYDGQRVNPREQTSLRAMVAFAAYDKNVHEEVIRGLVEQQFGIKDIAQLERDRYDAVIHFLVDLNIRECLN
jgi:hypothetical protein